MKFLAPAALAVSLACLSFAAGAQVIRVCTNPATHSSGQSDSPCPPGLIEDRVEVHDGKVTLPESTMRARNGEARGFGAAPARAPAPDSLPGFYANRAPALMPPPPAVPAEPETTPSQQLQAREDVAVNRTAAWLGRGLAYLVFNFLVAWWASAEGNRSTLNTILFLVLCPGSIVLRWLFFPSRDKFRISGR